jgi:hypothetical protein
MDRIILPAALCLAAAAASADPALVEDVTLVHGGDDWTVAVTIRHGDTGWDDYADGWRMETEGGAIIGTRVLLHPHVEEQPFTRSLGGVTLPAGTTEVFIRTRTSVTGWDDAVHGPVAVPMDAID